MGKRLPTIVSNSFKMVKLVRAVGDNICLFPFCPAVFTCVVV